MQNFVLFACMALFSLLGPQLYAQCDADAGLLMPDPVVSEQCVSDGESVSFWGAHVPGNFPVVPDGFKVIYVLTEGDDNVIVDTHKDGYFTVTEPGDYTVHTLVYDPNTLDLGTITLGTTTAAQVNALLIQGGGSICASLDLVGAPFMVTECECLADAGMLMPDPDVSDQCINPDETVTFWGAHVPGNFPVVPDGYKVIYVLTMGAELTIVDTNNDPFFTVLLAGNYTVHTLVYDPNTLDLSSVSTGFEVNAALIQGGGTICGSLDVAGAPFSVTACDDGCSVNAGKIMTGDPTTICADDGQSDPINVIVMMQNGGENSAWVITDEAGIILGLPAGPPFDLEGAGSGVCSIWYLVWDGTLTGLETGKNVKNLEGCHDLSNPIGVNRLTGDECEQPCVADAGKLMVDPSLEDLCVTQGETVQIAAAPVPANDPVVPDGYTVIYVLTKGDNLVIQGFGPDPVFNLLEPGKFTIHTLVYDPLTLDLGAIEFGVTTGGDILNIIAEDDICADLDAAGAMYTIDECPPPSCELDAGTISTNDETNICADDGKADLINVSVSGSSGGTQAIWVITDASGKILSLPTAPPFNFEGAGAGNCLIWYLVHDGTLTGAEVGNTAPNDLGGCYDLSNAIEVKREVDCGDEPCVVDGGTISTNDPTTICVDGVPDPIQVTLNSAVGEKGSWVITDADGIILGLPAGPPFDLDGAGPGACIIWYLSWTGEITGAGIGDNAENIEGCFDLSNPIVVTRNEAPVIIDSSSTSADECAEDGPTGTANVSVSGGTAPYVYSWDNGQTDATATGLAPGSYGVTVTDDKGCSASTTVTVGSSNSGVCIGDYVWLDGDRDGTQGRYEQGVEDIEVRLIQAGPDGQYCTDDDITVDETTTDKDGLYEFCCVAPGEYSILFDPVSLPIDFIFTERDAGGDDEKDSDADAVSGKTDPFTVIAGQDDNFSYDAGIRRECINIENGGEIEKDQTICRGAIPEKICVKVSPSGGAGDIEYLWMSSTNEGPFDPNTWTAIENSNDECYDPGQLFTTTYFILCTRRAGCDAYTGESNIVRITVTDCRKGFVDFDATPMGAKEVSLTWRTPLEEKGYTYEVERSPDGIEFESFKVALGNGPGNEINTYHVMDVNAKNGHNFYRIKLTDSLKEVFYSEVVKVVVRYDVEQRIIVYPNPVTNNRLTLETMDPFAGAVSVELLSSNGQVLKVINIDQGAIQKQIEFEDYPAGLYFIQIRYENADIEVIKVSKMK